MARSPNNPTVHGVALPNLRAWRLRKLMSMEMLSAASGVSTNTIHAMENGKGHARYKTVEKLAKGLGITAEQLVYEKPEEKSRGAA